MLVSENLVNGVSISAKITFTVSQPIFQSSMCIFNSFSCCIAKVSNLFDPCTNSLLFNLIHNRGLNIFQQIWIYRTHTVEKFIIEIHASIIYSTSILGLTSFLSSSLTCFVPTVGFTWLLTFFVMWYLQSNLDDVRNVVVTKFINVVSRSVIMTYGMFSWSFNIFLHISKPM